LKLSPFMVIQNLFWILFMLPFIRRAEFHLYHLIALIDVNNLEISVHVKPQWSSDYLF